MHPATISIDFGASFTKVAYRGKCMLTEPGQYSEDAALLMLDGSVLIPTLAIKTGRTKKAWVFGNDAANLVPGDGMTPYINWKAGLFNRSNNPDAAQSAIIGEAFFRWLRENIESASGSMKHKTVRIMLPAFRDFGELAGVVTRCMQMADWEPKNLVVGTEPHANALGILTRGRNCYSRGTKQEMIDFMAMYGHNNPYIKAARNAVLGDNAPDELRIAIVDIGAFTTDLAILVFQLTGGGGSDGLKQVKQESFALGTHTYLNEPLWNGLEQEHGTDFGGLSFNHKEEFKRALFSGESYALMIGPKRIIFGGKGDATLIQDLSRKFAEAIWDKIKGPLLEAQVSALYLTGGGAEIKPLVQALTSCGGRIREVPRATTPVAASTSTASFSPWSRCGQTLERVATAIGGASLLAPSVLDQAPIINLVLPPTARVVENANLVRCTCGGNNPDCSVCGGTGYR